MRTADTENFAIMRISGNFLSRLYCEDIFILSSDSEVSEGNDDYFYINGQIPSFYEEALAETYIKRLKINAGIPLTFSKIELAKISLLRHLPIKPVVYTTIDRRGLKEIKYYTDKDFKHILVDIDEYKQYNV